MLFCKCGKLMEVGGEGIRMAHCSCGFKQLISAGDGENSFEEKQKLKEKRSSEVVEHKHDLGGFPHTCGKCGYGECEVIELGVFYGDEAGVYLFKCKKCGYSERQSDGTGN